LNNAVCLECSSAGQAGIEIPLWLAETWYRLYAIPYEYVFGMISTLVFCKFVNSQMIESEKTGKDLGRGKLSEEDERLDQYDICCT
jgi:hypothetical protein